MGPTPISTAFLLASLVAVAAIEMAAAVIGASTPLPRLWLIAMTRSLQLVAVIVLAVNRTGGLQVLGLDRRSLLPGLWSGLVWSAGFAAAAGLLGLGLFLAGRQPLTWIRSPLPLEWPQRMLFFLVGGVVAPVVEEVVFRGLIFGYLRKYSLWAAIVISTALFAAIHAGPALPITQIVGGAVFAIAYHTAKSLAAPIVIHILGNLALFTLSLPFFQ